MHDDSLKFLIDLVNLFLKLYEVFEYNIQGQIVKMNLIKLIKFMLL